MIHQYKLNGYNIVLDTFSGSIHSVDDVAYDVIEFMDAHTDEQTVINELSAKYALDKQEIADCIADVKELTAQGKLFTEDTFSPIATAFKEKSGNVIKALCLHVAHTCNLNCSYCFASQGKYHGDRALMSFETGKRALDFLIENSGTADELAGCKRPCKVRPLRRKGEKQKFPLYVNYQRNADRRRRDRLLQQGNE